MSLTESSNTLYELKNVERKYNFKSNEVLAIKDVSLEISEGELLILEGPSGSGKSTLLQMLGVLDLPTKGSISFLGESLDKASDKVRTKLRSLKIGFIFQQFNLIPTLSALDNVELAMVPTKAKKSAREARAKELLERVGLSHRLNHMPSKLSGGEQQRVAIARALANTPQVLIADEPTGNLDSESSRQAMDLLRGLMTQSERVTVIVATHDKDIAKYGTRTLKVKDGLLV